MKEDTAAQEKKQADADVLEDEKPPEEAKPATTADTAGKEKKQEEVDVAAALGDEEPVAEAKPEVPAETNLTEGRGWQRGEGGGASRNRCRSKS